MVDQLQGGWCSHRLVANDQQGKGQITYSVVLKSTNDKNSDDKA